MNGSEKQITWAKQIQQSITDQIKANISKLNDRINDPDYDPEYDGKKEDILAGIEYYEATISDIENTEDAAWFIDNKDRFTKYTHIAYDADCVAVSLVNGPVTTDRINIIKKYRSTNIRFAK